MKKIIIVSSRFYCGGTLVLSLLCKLLQEHGLDTKIFYVHTFPSEKDKFIVFWYRWLIYTLKYRIKILIFNTIKNTKYAENKKYSLINRYIPIKGIKEKILPFYNRKNTIVIYPEVVYGNFLCAKHVVRYLLYHYNYKRKENAYNNNDTFICYREIFNDWELNPLGIKLNLNYFDNNLYRQYNFNERKGNCYILRKGKNRIDLPNSFDGPVIDSDTKETDIVKIFNTCKFCYSYDTQTFYTSIAAVCGCIPIVVLEPGKTKDDYLNKNENNIPGVAYGNSKEEIDYAIRTRNDLLKNLDFSESNEDNIIKFITFLNKKFH